jgi:hypothetical protein
MRTIAALVLSLSFIVAAVGCSKSEPAPTSKAGVTAPAAGKWICPMDKDVVADKPGNCPKCGMKLELKK